jgi:hypothetical protein
MRDDTNPEDIVLKIYLRRSFFWAKLCLTLPPGSILVGYNLGS